MTGLLIQVYADRGRIAVLREGIVVVGGALGALAREDDLRLDRDRRPHWDGGEGADDESGTGIRILDPTSTQVLHIQPTLEPERRLLCQAHCGHAEQDSDKQD